MKKLLALLLALALTLSFTGCHGTLAFLRGESRRFQFLSGSR